MYKLTLENEKYCGMSFTFNSTGEMYSFLLTALNAGEDVKAIVERGETNDYGKTDENPDGDKSTEKPLQFVREV